MQGTTITFAFMTKRTRKPVADENVSAFDAVNRLTGAPSPKARPKNKAAVRLGILGGRKGGKARAKSLTPERRAEIAKQAAAARWARRNDK
jgi:hypothetical protein